MTQTAASLPRRLEASQHPLVLQLLSPFYSPQGFRKGRHSRKHTFFKSTRQFVNQTVKITVLSFCFFSLRAVFFLLKFLRKKQGPACKEDLCYPASVQGQGCLYFAEKPVGPCGPFYDGGREEGGRDDKWSLRWKMNCLVEGVLG